MPFLLGGVPKEDFDFVKCSRAHFGDQKVICVVQLLPKQQTVEQVCGVTWGAPQSSMLWLHRTRCALTCFGFRWQIPETASFRGPFASRVSPPGLFQNRVETVFSSEECW